ncbi:MAG: threonylcarbamoyl-AMP synthase [Xanthomonadales bacterium]|nr:threonylcarbamoyl-AMP synthase [Xanthomonadales bacterium]
MTEIPKPGRSISADIEAALTCLRAGELVAIPTETVYGLAADAHSDAALRRIFALKGRPADHPLILHLGDVSWLSRYAAKVPDYALSLALEHWPGPLTLVLPASRLVSRVATGGQDTVALRMPRHTLTQQLLRAFGRAVAAPSANRYGSISPTSAADVRAEFGAEAPLVLDGGPCSEGIESTIIDCTGPAPRLLRPGSIRLSELAPVADREGPRAPGRVDRHYAPRTPAWLASQSDWPTAVAKARRQAMRWRVLGCGALPEGVAGLALPAEPVGYAHGLYAALRQLDRTGAAHLLVQAPPADEAWLAVHDRLRRATQRWLDQAGASVDYADQ